MGIRADSMLLEPGNLVRLIELNGSVIDPTAGVLRFHPYDQEGPIVWRGQEYHPWPVELTGFEKSGDRPATPTMIAGNVGQALTRLCLQFDDMVGAIVTVRSTLAKYLDAVNFMGPELVQNADLSSDLTGWAVGSGYAAVVGGELNLGHSAGDSNLYQAVPTEAGKVYQLTATVKSGAVGVYMGASVGTSNVVSHVTWGVGINTLTFTGTGNPVYLTLHRSAGAAASRLVDVSVKEVVGNPTADPTQQYPDEIWFIDRKEHEDFRSVKWALASALDFNGIQLPSRIIVSNQCSWMYRGPECGYAGVPVAKYDDTPTTDPALDQCSRRVTGCKLRFGADSPLPYGSFPAAGLMRV